MFYIYVLLLIIFIYGIEIKNFVDNLKNLPHIILNNFCKCPEGIFVSMSTSCSNPLFYVPRGDFKRIPRTDMDDQCMQNRTRPQELEEHTSKHIHRQLCAKSRKHQRKTFLHRSNWPKKYEQEQQRQNAHAKQHLSCTVLF